MLSSLRVAARRAVRPTFSAVPFRGLSVSARLRSDAHSQPIVVGEGAKPGEVATDENQSTGLERYQIEGQLQGIDVFDMQGIPMSRQGTLKDPVIVPTFTPMRQIGCTGFPVDSHDTIWITGSIEREHTRCPECGNVYKLQLVNLPGTDSASHIHHHH